MTIRKDSIRIYKFGGASVKSADAIINLANILKNEEGKLVVVISAIGKTTNALESVLSRFIKGDSVLWEEYSEIKKLHNSILGKLFPSNNFRAFKELEQIFNSMESILNDQPADDYNYIYDQWVSFGEILSTTIISAYLNSLGVTNKWVDIRGVLVTDNNYREGNVDYSKSKRLCGKAFTFEDHNLYITQGFLGGTVQGCTTTLGREGSDYSAAILANLLNASSVTIWKDVDGVLNVDPRIFPNPIKLNEVSFKEAIELAYCGAQIIHPKTIKPLQNKQISLYVKSFNNPTDKGTLVFETERRIEYPPILVLKKNQVLISLSPKDFSFVIEDCLSKIFGTLCTHRVKANLVQSSAISFSICVDDEEHFLPGAIQELKNSFTVKYNRNLELLTIRHFTQDEIDKNTRGKKILLSQKTRSTIRLVLF